VRIRLSTALLAAAGSVTLLLAAAPAMAHHAFAAEFDGKKPVKLSGTITQIEWINPHAWLHMDVKTTDGKTQKWEIELAAPNGLIRRGWTKGSVPTGTEVVIIGYQAKDGTLKANAREANFPDGRKMFVGSSGTGAPEFPEKKK
jgi:Family of unknown function (DUF6152)